MPDLLGLVAILVQIVVLRLTQLRYALKIVESKKINILLTFKFKNQICIDFKLKAMIFTNVKTRL